METPAGTDDINATTITGKRNSSNYWDVTWQRMSTTADQYDTNFTFGLINVSLSYGAGDALGDNSTDNFTFNGS